jgi:hypothetical protein
MASPCSSRLREGAGIDVFPWGNRQKIPPETFPELNERLKAELKSDIECREKFVAKYKQAECDTSAAARDLEYKMRLTPLTTFAGLLALVSYTKDFVFNDGMGDSRSYPNFCTPWTRRSPAWQDFRHQRRYPRSRRQDVRIYSSKAPGALLSEVPLQPDRIVRLGSELIITVASGRGLARIVLTPYDIAVLSTALARNDENEQQGCQTQAR